MIRVRPLPAVPRNEALRVGVEPPIAVIHTEDGEVFAVDDACTHDVWTQSVGHPAEADSVTVEEGSVGATTSLRSTTAATSRSASST